MPSPVPAWSGLRLSLAQAPVCLTHFHLRTLGARSAGRSQLRSPRSLTARPAPSAPEAPPPTRDRKRKYVLAAILQCSCLSRPVVRGSGLRGVRKSGGLKWWPSCVDAGELVVPSRPRRPPRHLFRRLPALESLPLQAVGRLFQGGGRSRSVVRDGPRSLCIRSSPLFSLSSLARVVSLEGKASLFFGHGDSSPDAFTDLGIREVWLNLFRWWASVMLGKLYSGGKINILRLLGEDVYLITLNT